MMQICYKKVIMIKSASNNLSLGGHIKGVWAKSQGPLGRSWRVARQRAMAAKWLKKRERKMKTRIAAKASGLHNGLINTYVQWVVPGQHGTNSLGMGEVQKTANEVENKNHASLPCLSSTLPFLLDWDTSCFVAVECPDESLFLYVEGDLIELVLPCSCARVYSLHSAFIVKVVGSFIYKCPKLAWSSRCYSSLRVCLYCTLWNKNVLAHYLYFCSLFSFHIPFELIDLFIHSSSIAALYWLELSWIQSLSQNTKHSVENIP